jgi:hypothetical protein
MSIALQAGRAEAGRGSVLESQKSPFKISCQLTVRVRGAVVCTDPEVAVTVMV